MVWLFLGNQATGIVNGTYRMRFVITVGTQACFRNNITIGMITHVHDCRTTLLNGSQVGGTVISEGFCFVPANLQRL